MPRISVNAQTQPDSRQAPSLRPLSHHEIMRLIGPFSERGWRLDLTATEREERLLRFQLVTHPGGADGIPVFHERLTAAVSQDDEFLLVRELWLSGDADATASPTLTASGPDAGVLLDQFARVAVSRHFADVDGVIVRRSYRLDPQRNNAERTGAAWDLRIVSATAELPALRAEFDAGMRGMPVDVRLYPRSAERLDPPRDLLAVIGRQWRSLQEYPNHWRSTINAPRREPRRTADIELKVAQTIRHLHQTLSKAPARFHDQHRWARWRAAARSGKAIFLTLLLVVGTLLLNQVADEALIRALAFGAPPLMVLMLFFAFDHLPAFEVPRIPRALKPDSWPAPADG
jgi:hypothetical protein